MDPRRVLIFIIIGMLGAYAWWRVEHRDGRLPGTFTPAEAPKLDLDQVKVLAALDAEYTRLVEAVMPGVVSITSSREGYQRLPRTLDDVLRGQQRVQKAKSTSLGSGVIVSKEGHILTNHHVIAGTTEIRVQLTDGRNVPARLIGSDPATDIAVLHIAEKNIEPLPLGDSDALRVGQQVFAVGNPYGLDETVTRGIVSATGRRLRNEGVDFIQHDAAVNQGNSGGPLLNIRGQIVGINSRILSENGGFVGISLAIPANLARSVLDSIISRGRLVRPWLGVSMQDISPAIARNFGLPDTVGAIIADISPGSPAALAGLRPGDVVRSFGGKAVANIQELGHLIAAAEIGKPVELRIIRDRREGTASVTITEMPAQAGR